MSKLRKIIFLDIDGVLQPMSCAEDRFKHDLVALQKEMSERFNEELYLKMDKYDIGAVYYDWEKESVELLRKLIKETEAEIVISSDWRRYNSLKKLKLLFKIHNMDQYVVDVTPEETLTQEKESKKYLTREEEIKAYLLQYEKEISVYVILDDRLLEGLGKNFVHINSPYFLKKEEYLAAKAILQEEST